MNTSPDTDTIRILVVEDHGIVRQGIVAILQLQSNFHIVAEAKDGVEAIALYKQHQPDITLMDLRMPNLEGVEAITQIRAHHPEAQIIILTTYDTDEDIYRGLQAGARGYILKDADFEELLDAVHTVYSGKRYLPSNVALKLLERMDREELTEREQDVLNLMVLGTSTAALAEALQISEGTVKFHMNHIFQKLGVNDRTQAIITALRRGLVRLNE
ncbi:response regulator transcription factor [filamentous cyanobacterium LEGE 11480]|uniref:Response regulator transcription factor n=1 Tax=Romeriopsis navalis LEGE 11480 TaxID=2777977 RepID=A0A928Z3K6_9CYAN|nr:response regulator transcription factor [Romeriopsis navalis]MBE9030122.1 response regulator transcription factor [Romeriopsis navalis LEGE 11480]